MFPLLKTIKKDILANLNGRELKDTVVQFYIWKSVEARQYQRKAKLRNLENKYGLRNKLRINIVYKNNDTMVLK